MTSRQWTVTGFLEEVKHKQGVGLGHRPKSLVNHQSAASLARVNEGATGRVYYHLTVGFVMTKFNTFHRSCKAT
jgi:hypothetical protein